ncbi:retinol dehydrogenase 11 [Xylariaceae sp. FL1272]|nr:retinol dehydrogenase 11 [Xylariaceae sp. FL1272]
MWDPAKEIKDLRNKVVLITGGTAGLGRQCVLQLAPKKAGHIYFTGRDAERGNAVIKEAAAKGSETPLTFIQCDLASLASCQAAATRILSEQSRLDVLIANAGVMNKPPGLTVDGYELQFGTNFLGHALLIKKLLPLMERVALEVENADVRVVQLTSVGFRSTPAGGIKFDDLRTEQDLPGRGGMLRYGQSKLASILYAQELGRRHPSVCSTSVTPGIVDTDLVAEQSTIQRGVIWLAAKVLQGGMFTPEQGAASELWCAFGPRKDIVQGAYYEPVGKVSKISTQYSRDKELASRLWNWTDEELKSWL